MKERRLAKLGRGKKCMEFLHKISGGRTFGEEAIIFRLITFPHGAIYQTYLGFLRPLLMSRDNVHPKWGSKGRVSFMFLADVSEEKKNGTKWCLAWANPHPAPMWTRHQRPTHQHVRPIYNPAHAAPLKREAGTHTGQNDVQEWLQLRQMAAECSDKVQSGSSVLTHAINKWRQLGGQQSHGTRTHLCVCLASPSEFISAPESRHTLDSDALGSHAVLPFSGQTPFKKPGSVYVLAFLSLGRASETCFRIKSPGFTHVAYSLDNPPINTWCELKYPFCSKLASVYSGVFWRDNDIGITRQPVKTWGISLE